MDINLAIRLVRSKYLDELAESEHQDTTDEYNLSCELYPAVMQTAHYLWAIQIAQDVAQR